MARTTNGLKILQNVTGKSPALKEGIANARINLEVAQMIYDSRTRAGLSQRQLADLIGSKQPVIARLEDADYKGHSLNMLQRIADALEQCLEVRFVPSRKRRGLGSSHRKAKVNSPKHKKRRVVAKAPKRHSRRRSRRQRVDR